MPALQALLDTLGVETCDSPRRLRTSRRLASVARRARCRDFALTPLTSRRGALASVARHARCRDVALIEAPPVGNECSQALLDTLGVETAQRLAGHQRQNLASVARHARCRDGRSVGAHAQSRTPLLPMLGALGVETIRSSLILYTRSQALLDALSVETTSCSSCGTAVPRAQALQALLDALGVETMQVVSPRA